MKYMKDFRGFLNESQKESDEVFETALVITNPEALKAVEKEESFKTLKPTDNGYEGSEEAIQRVAKKLKDDGFSMKKDFIINEALLETAGLDLVVKEKGDDHITISINGHDYSYTESGAGKDGKGNAIDFKEVCRKFEKMLQFSAGRGLQYLIKNTKLVGGSKKKNKDGTTPTGGVNEDLHIEKIGHVSLHTMKNTVEFSDEEKKALKESKMKIHSKGNAHSDGTDEAILKVGNNHFIFVYEDGSGVEYNDADLGTVLSHEGIVERSPEA